MKGRNIMCIRKTCYLSTLLSLCFPAVLFGQQPRDASHAPEKIIIDTDIGSDIDDAFAVALAIRSPELEILGIATDSGDTNERAKILDRMLAEVGRPGIPVAVGVSSPPNPHNREWDSVIQGRYGDNSRFPPKTHPNAVDFILDQIRHYPGQITLVAIGPIPNIGAMIDKSPDTFRQIKRVVMMGGSINPIKPDFGNAPPLQQQREYNIYGDTVSSQKLFRSGVPIVLVPLDSTLHLTLDETKRAAIFTQSTPLTDALTLLYQLWGQRTPDLIDPMTIGYIVDPTLCPVRPMRIRVDDSGYTRVESGAPNAQVCLHSDADTFIHFYLNRILSPQSSPQLASRQ